MKCYVLRRLRAISLGMFIFLGFFGWTHFLPSLFTYEGKGQVWMTTVPPLIALMVVLFNFIVLENKLSPKKMGLIWFVGVGYSGGFDLIQQQHSTLLFITFQVFALTPIFLAILYWVLINKQQHSK